MDQCIEQKPPRPNTSTLLLFAFLAIWPSCREADTSSSSTSFVLEGITIGELQKKLAEGEYTSVQLTQLYLDRIREIDQSGPELRAVIEINPDALAIAAQLDAERANHQTRGPLHGIPILIKDNIETGDKMQTTAGSLAMVGNRPKEDAFVIQQLRHAGAIILGKTNLTEWSNFRSVQSLSGWSSRGGQTKNPYVLTSTPCGSSTGSAVAVSADLCVIAVGTSTDGSIACPSSFAGVVGIRPTLGLVSRSGTIPIAKSQDTPGPIARTVRDAAILLGAMTGPDIDDPATHASQRKILSDYTPFLQPDALRGKIIGIDKSMLGQTEGRGELLQEAILQMKQQGAIIVEIEFRSKYEGLLKAESDLLKFEFKAGINAYLTASQSQMKSLADIIRFNAEHVNEVMPYFRQDLMENAQAMPGLDHPAYLEAKELLSTMEPYLDSLMTSHHLDAIAGVGNVAYSPPAIAGWPSVTVPMGFINEVPVGLTFFARAYEEPKLLAIAYAYEQVSQKRRSPKFLPAMKSS